MEALAWMAWTWQTALFFVGVVSLLALMTALAIWRPETARVGVLGIPTTRGDRLFVSLVGAAFVHLVWLGVSTALGVEEPNLWLASGLSLVYATAVFGLV